MDILKAEIARKRKLLEEKNVLVSVQSIKLCSRTLIYSKVPLVYIRLFIFLGTEQEIFQAR